MENRRYDILVAGAGPAGLMAGISAKLHDPFCSVVIAEKMRSPGQKLLITGKGQCNLTRTDAIPDFLSCYGTNGRFLKKSLYSFPSTDLMDFFTERGCPLAERDDKKVFPQSMKAGDILKVLTDTARDLGVSIETDSPVETITDTGSQFRITSKNKTYDAKSLILCCGGRSYPATGSSGDGYRLAQSLGHSITPLHPALAPVYCNNFPFTECAGISFEESAVSIYIDGKKKHEIAGPLLITHDGFSGPAILHSSRYLSGSAEIVLNFIPGKIEEDFSSEIIHSAGSITVSGFLTRHIPKGFSRAICRHLSINTECRLSELKKEDRKGILQTLFRYNPKTYRVGSYNEAMVTAGGISLVEVSPKTMESRICPRLYFAGELLDIDGNTGGYNLQAAFSTGYTAGKSSAQSTVSS